MKTAIFQILIGPSRNQEYCIDSVKKYCSKYNIDHFISTKCLINGPHIMFEKYQLFHLLQSEYERVLYLDADILITPNAKNIFEIYNDENKFYAYDENDLSEHMDRDKYIFENDSSIEWPKNNKNKKQYFNGGVMLFSKKMLNDFIKAFSFSDIPNWNDIYYFGDQTIINYWIAKNKIKFETIDHSFNRMDLGKMDEKNERFNSNFIHYAGPCKYGNGNKQETIKKDYYSLYPEIQNEDFRNNESVKIDIAHANLITGLILSQKPKNILELGLGGARSCDAIIKAIDYNNNNPKFTIVDNWLDWNGVMPKNIYETYGKKANIITMDEKEFIFSIKDKYDFIMSDADHNRTDQWFEYVYDNILEQGGILIYHDINLIEDCFINLRSIYEKCKERNLHHYLFNKNSLLHERCQRGLLVIFKNK